MNQMNHFLIPIASEWIRYAEIRYGMYSEKTTKVRAYLIHLVEPDKCVEAVDVPKELADLGYPDNSIRFVEGVRK